MRLRKFDIVSPITKEKLRQKGDKLLDESGAEFEIVCDVPVLLPKEYTAEWHRELIEIMLWAHPEEIEKIYKEKDWSAEPVGVYLRYIKRILHDKEGILSAIENYSKQDTARWILPVKSKCISDEQIADFKEFSSEAIGSRRTQTKISGEGIFAPYQYFGKQANVNNPEIIVELGTGAGGGTAAVALNMREKAVLYTVDIGFECLGNAVGIGKYQKKNIVPVCANFWFLPFADESTDSVFTYNGLDESREIEKTVAEVSRILKSGGMFTVASRKNAFMRQAAVLEPFGFTQNEAVELLKKCRLYSDTEMLTEICRENGFELVSSREFVINESLIEVVSQFQKLNK